MFRYKYYADRVQEVPPGSGAVAGKVQAILGGTVGTQTERMIQGLSGIPPRVLGSMMMRHRTLWGRYE